MFLIDDLLLLPVKGFLGIFKRIHEMAEKELLDKTHIQKRLMTLRLRLELDEISEEEYNKQEKELLALLDAARGINEGVEEEVHKDGEYR
jgi:hypothetical protein